MEDLERIVELNPPVSEQPVGIDQGTSAPIVENIPLPEEAYFPEYLDEEAKPPEAAPQPAVPAPEPVVAAAPVVAPRNNRRNRGNQNNNVPPLVAANPTPAPARPTLTTHQLLKEKKHNFAKHLIFLFTIFVFWKTLTEHYDENCNVTGYLQPSFLSSAASNATNTTESTNTTVTEQPQTPAENKAPEEASPLNTEEARTEIAEEKSNWSLGFGFKYVTGFIPESWRIWNSIIPEEKVAVAESTSTKCSAARSWYYFLIFADIFIGLMTIGQLQAKPMGNYFIERWFGYPFVNPMTSKAVTTVSIWFLIHYRSYTGEGWYYDILNTVSRPSHLVLATWLVGSLFSTHAKSRTAYKGLQATYIPRVGPFKSMAQLSFNLLPASLVLLGWCTYFGLFTQEASMAWSNTILEKWAWTSFGYSVILAGIALVIGGFYFLTNSWGMCFSLYYTGLSQNYSIDVPLVYIIVALNEKKFLIPKIGLIDSSYVILIVLFLKTLNLLIHNQNRRNAIDRNQIVFVNQTLLDATLKIPERPAAAEKTETSVYKRKYKRASGGMKKLIVPEWFNKKAVDSDSFACCICMTRRSNCVILPCFHSELCHLCAVDIMRDPSRRCYLCLTPISAIHRLKIDFEMKKDELFVDPATVVAATADIKVGDEEIKKKAQEQKAPKRFDKGLLTAETMSFE